MHNEFFSSLTCQEKDESSDLTAVLLKRQSERNTHPRNLQTISQHRKRQAGSLSPSLLAYFTELHIVSFPEKVFYTCLTGDLIDDVTHKNHIFWTSCNTQCRDHQLQMNLSLSSPPSRIEPVQTQLNWRTITPCSIDFISCRSPLSVLNCPRCGLPGWPRFFVLVTGCSLDFCFASKECFFNHCAAMIQFHWVGQRK